MNFTIYQKKKSNSSWIIIIDKSRGVLQNAPTSVL